MSNILFIEKKTRADKLGILYLSSILKNGGHKVDLIQDDIDNAENYLQKNQVDFVMYSVMSGSHKWFIEKNKELKKKFDFISVVGGPHFTFFSEYAKEDTNIDYCVIGPGEEVILDIVEGRISDKIIKGNIPCDINLLPEPDRSILYKYDEFGKSKMKRFIAGRDCPNSCKYCFNHLFHKIYSDQKKCFFQITNVDKIIDEMLKVKKEYGLELVYFNDDDIAVNLRWLEEFCLKFKDRVGIKFGGNVRANNVSREILKMMSDSGCVLLHVSVESSNKETQNFLRRGNIKNSHIVEACKNGEEFGIKIRLQNMIGLPLENPLKDALDTLKFNQDLSVSDSRVSIYQPLPKTDLWKYCVENGFVDESADCMNFEEDTILKIPNAEEINSLQKWWYFAVKYKLPIDFIKMIIKQPLTKEIKDGIREFTWNEVAENFFNV